MESRDLNAAAVRRILDGLDLAPGEPSFIARASTCEVWRAGTSGGPVAVRLLAPRPGKPSNVDADIALRRRLLAAAPSLPLARPIADNSGRPDLTIGTPWAVDRWIDGDPADHDTDDAVWRDLGRLLAVLHAVPVAGHGRLAAGSRDLSGRCDDPLAGIADRFEAPWPFDGQPLAGHPVAMAAPELTAHLARLEPPIRAADAALLALVVALHHVSRARTLDLPTRRTTALARLRLDLEAIGAG